MKIVADENIPFVKEAFAEFGVVSTVPGHKITKELCKDASILLVRSVTKVDGDLLEDSSVKFVATATIGTDHIDTSYLQNEGIGFASAPGSNANSVAEYIVAALLNCAHTKKFKLKDCTLGIIGVGNIGSIVFKKAQTLGMHCLLNDPPKKRLTNSDLYRPLDEVLSNADIVTLHVPLTMEEPDKTHHMVNPDFLLSMKDEAMLINTSRGEVVDENAVCEMAAQKLKGLVIDVWETEPTINSNLLTLADIGTSHIAGYSYNGKIQGTGMIHDAACSFFFKEKKWYMDEIVNKLKGRTIDVSKSKELVHDVVKEAYPILNDDEKLRRIVKLKENKQGEYFEELRKNYPKRLEFSHFTVESDTLGKKDREILINLGFQIKN